MAPSSPRTKHALSYVPDELVVATPHLDMVAEALYGGVRVLRADDRLGLTRVAVDDVEDAAARLASTAPSDKELESTGPLDLVLTSLRASFARRWDGWVPTVGKNRDVLGGETPYIKVLAEPEGPQRAQQPPSPYAGEAVRDERDGGDGVRIGLLDTAVTPAIAAQPWIVTTPADVLGAADPAPYRLGHGTFLAGLLNQYAPRATVTARAVIDGPDATGTAWDVAVGLLDLVGVGRPDGAGAQVDVVVMALGCFTADRRPPLVLKTAVDIVRDDVVLLAAAGNHADMRLEDIRRTGLTRHSPMWPAALDGVTAFGSVTPDGHACAYSPSAPWVDLCARGDGLVSTYFDAKVSFGADPSGAERVEAFGGWASWRGTSLAVAVAAGRLAVLREDGEPLRRTLSRLRASGDAPYVVRTPL